MQTILDSRTCLTLEADNIVLECDDYVIIWDRTGYGIYMNSRINVTIEDCRVENFTNGIY